HASDPPPPPFLNEPDRHGRGAATLGRYGPVCTPLVVIYRPIVPGHRRIVGEAELLDRGGERCLVLLSAECLGGGSVSFRGLALAHQNEELFRCVHDGLRHGKDCDDAGVDKERNPRTKANAQDTGDATADQPTFFHDDTGPFRKGKTWPARRG